MNAEKIMVNLLTAILTEFLTALVVMCGLAIAHAGHHPTPALGYWTCFGLTIAVTSLISAGTYRAGAGVSR